MTGLSGHDLVHNHGIDPSCRERRIDGQLRGECLSTSCCSTGSPGVTQIDNAGPTSSDPVTRPAHYRAHPSGVECITITRHMNFNLGNATKYIWRAGLKGDALEDLRKAAFYIADEIARIEGQS